MQNKLTLVVATTCLSLLGAAATAEAQQAAAPAAPAAAPAPAKPTIPSLPDILTATGIAVTGYVDGTFSYFNYSGSHLSGGGASEASAANSYNTFMFQQAGLNIAYQPSAGFGGVLDVVATPYSSIYINNYAPDPNYYLGSGTKPGAPTVAILQSYAQWVGGPWTLIAGKFSTLAGAEVYEPTGNTNVTRSILFTFEPVTHTGVRATYTANSVVTLNLGVNNGWFNYADETSLGSPKTLEAGISLTLSKALSWSFQDYYGSDENLYGTTTPLNLFDTVLTWNATSALTLIGSADVGNVQSSSTSPSASWWGLAGYLNYQINPQWRLSLRGEYFDDQDGYLTDAVYAGTPLLPSAGPEHLNEVTLTFGYDPNKHLELRLEARHDDPDSVTPSSGGPGVKVYSASTQGWLEALFHF